MSSYGGHCGAAGEFRALARKHGLAAEFTEKLIKFHAGDET